MSAIETVATATFVPLICDTKQVPMTKVITVASGAGKLTKGTILGEVTATKKCVKVTTGQTDGSSVAKYILAADIDATSADVASEVFATGCFNQAALIVGDSDTVDAHVDELHDRSIFVEAVQG